MYTNAEAYKEPRQTTNMKISERITKDFQSLTIFVKNSISEA